MTRPAAAAYASAKVELEHAIAELTLHVRAHGVGEKLHYGHVGDVQHALKTIAQLNAFFRGEG